MLTDKNSEGRLQEIGKPALFSFESETDQSVKAIHRRAI
jgi:hypothetical protein